MQHQYRPGPKAIRLAVRATESRNAPWVKGTTHSTNMGRGPSFALMVPLAWMFGNVQGN